MATLAPPADGSDARDLIQAAILRDGIARLGPGWFVIKAKSPGSRWDCLQLRGRQSIVGSGPSTVLAFEGSGITQHPTTGITSGDCRGISIYGDNNLVADCLIDTSRWVDTSEQTHPVHVTGPARHNTIHGVTFYHPQRFDPAGSPWPGGDCIKIASYDKTPSSTLIEGCHFVECDRSAIASVGGFEALIVKGCIFYSTGDQDIDVEGSEQTGENILLDGNVHRTSKGGGYAIQIGLREGRNVHVANCILDGRGIFFGGTKRLTLSNTTIVQRQSGAPTVDVVKATDDVRLIGCTIVRAASALPNTVVKVQHHGTGMPGTVDLDGCTIRNETGSASCLNVQSAREVGLRGSRFEWRPSTGQLGATHTLTSVAGLAQRTDALTVNGCRFSGPATRALQINDKDKGIGLVTLTGNTSAIPIYVQRATSTPFGPIVSSGNNWPAPIGNGEFTEGR